MAVPEYNFQCPSFALLVADEYQRRGIGTELLRRLVQIGRDEKLSRITGEILRDNYGKMRISGKLGFQLHGPEVDRVGGFNRPMEACLVLRDE